MNWLDVFCFISVSRTRSFSVSARELMISQQAVSRHIQNLEEETGLQLFLRNYHELHLTRAGERMLDCLVQRENMVKAFGINIETPMLTPEFRKGLVKVIKSHAGKIPLEVFFFDPETRYRIQLKSNKYQVAVSTELLNDLRHLGVDQFEVVRK